MTVSNVVDRFPSPPSPHARPLRYWQHHTYPAEDRVSRQEWRLELHLSLLWDALMDPAEATRLWEAGIGTLRTADLLDAVLDASDAAADAELRQSDAVRAREVYADALHELATAILGVQR